MAAKNSKSIVPQLAFWSLGIIWGSNFLYMKLAAQYITPIQIVFLRVLLSLIPIAIYAFSIKAVKKQHWRFSHHFLVMSLLATAIYYFCFAKGSQLLYSGIAGALSGSAPIFTFILGLMFLKEEKINTNKILGLLCCIFGILLIAKPFQGEVLPQTLEGIVYMLIGSLSFGASFIYAKKFIIPLKIHGAALTLYQMFFAALILSVIIDYDNISNILQNTEATWGLIVGLGILGTGIAYLFYYFIIEKMGAVRASSVAYIAPVVALTVGVIIAQEPIDWTDFLATSLILGGVILLKKN